MTEFILVDTDILIDAGRGINEAIDYLQELERSTRLAVSVVTQMELIVGCRNKAELTALEQFLRRFRILQINETISSQAVELLQQYRLSHGLLIADALIAATALSWDSPFVSKNQRDYRFIADLDLLPYP
ncbi:MAG: type II toxin-antitoxin system VapC family toxin [Caldilineae bacterium]|nr:MAG: type II toxin-antitoxin system VapC family toxin [Caldilineae bacterium]